MSEEIETPSFEEGIPLEMKVTPEEMKTEFLRNVEWPLERGILYCVGIRPSKYQWPAYGGNDLPTRVRTFCRKAITKGELPALDVKGKTIVDRDELIKFCYKNWHKFCRDTWKIWSAYKKQSPLPSPGKNSSRRTTSLRHAMDAAYGRALIEEYTAHKQAYDTGIKNLKKEDLYKKILDRHDSWKYENLRQSGKNIGIEWAQENLHSFE